MLAQHSIRVQRVLVCLYIYYRTSECACPSSKVRPYISSYALIKAFAKLEKSAVESDVSDIVFLVTLYYFFRMRAEYK